MSVIHEIHFAGCDKSVELELETDDLYTKFVAWLKGDNIRGMVVETEDHTIAISFAQVGSITIGEKPKKRMGFSN
jgi:hypothetical protein